MDYEAFTNNLIAELRANAGRVSSGPMAGKPLMILNSIGAKSGTERTAIITFSTDGDRYVIAATASGSPTNPGWYYNLLANPQATVEAGGQKFRARAEVAEGAERERLWEQHATKLPEFRDYPSKITRQIPVITLDRLT